MSEDIEIKVYTDNGAWMAAYGDFLARADTLPAVIDAMTNKLFEAEVASVGRGVMPPADIAAFCAAYRNRSQSIWWKVVPPEPTDFIPIELDLDGPGVN